MADEKENLSVIENEEKLHAVVGGMLSESKIFKCRCLQCGESWIGPKVTSCPKKFRGFGLRFVRICGGQVICEEIKVAIKTEEKSLN